MTEPTITIRELVEEIDRQWQKGLNGDDAMRFLLPLTRKLLDKAVPTTAWGEPVAAEVVAAHQTPSLHPGHEVQRGSNEKVWSIVCQCGFERSGPRDFVNTGDQQAEAIRDHHQAVHGA